MATVTNGILGDFSGTVGSIVGSSWRGLQVIRALPKISKNRKFSPAQLEQQAKFGMVVSYLQPLTTLFNLTFKGARKKTPFNVATRYTVENAVTGINPNFAIDWPKLQICRGSLQHVADSQASIETGDIIIFEWRAITQANDPNYTDRAIMVVYSPASRRCIFDTTSAMKSHGTGTIAASTFNGEVVHTYLAFMTADGKKFSNTVYTGQLNV